MYQVGSHITRVEREAAARARSIVLSALVGCSRKRRTASNDPVGLPIVRLVVVCVVSNATVCPLFAVRFAKSTVNENAHTQLSSLRAKARTWYNAHPPRRA